LLTFLLLQAIIFFAMIFANDFVDRENQSMLIT